MTIIDSNASIATYSAHLKAFEALYIQAFPDENEREYFEDILARIDNPVGQPSSIIGLITQEETVLAGVVLDVFDNDFFHLIYLVVNPDFRNSGIGKTIMTDGLKQLVLSRNPNIDGVFLESNIPWKTTEDAFDPTLRMNIFKRYGVKWIPMEYIQPSLSSDKEPVKNLFLLFLPFNANQESISYRYTIEFLTRFYQGLHCDPASSDEFQIMVNQLNFININNQITLKEIPMQESSLYQFHRASICLQFSVEEAQSKETLPCDHFHSYETDLLSYHFQRDRPFTSRYQDGFSKEDITIHFPETYTYHSEGRSYEMVNERPVIQASLKLSRTDFKGSTNTVWSVVLMNKDGDYFSELEIIKLSAYFGSSQERTGLKSCIKFSHSNTTPLVLEDFIKDLLGLQNHNVFTGSGILQLDTAQISMKDGANDTDWDDFYQVMNDSLGKENAYVELNNKYDEDEFYEGFLNLLCGFALGIFDYNRMGFDEVVDTLQLLKGDNGYLLFVNRGVMMNLCHEDEMFEAVLDNIGISPYLLIPNAVLNNNTFYLESALGNLKSLQFDTEATETLQRLRKTSEHALNSGVISNVFHYKTEKTIFDFCSTERNHALMVNKINASLDELQQLLSERKSIREDRSDLFMTLLLTVMSCLQFQGIFQSIANNNLLMSWVYTITFSITITTMIYTLLRMKK